MEHKCEHCGVISPHIWSKWMPRSQFVKYRICLHPGCDVFENREVKVVPNAPH